jgi:hypothetical protein
MHHVYAHSPLDSKCVYQAKCQDILSRSYMPASASWNTSTPGISQTMGGDQVLGKTRDHMIGLVSTSVVGSCCYTWEGERLEASCGAIK